LHDEIVGKTPGIALDLLLEPLCRDSIEFSKDRCREFPGDIFRSKWLTARSN